MEKISLITGVSRDTGLGYETAKQVDALGYTVIITARDIEKVKTIADKDHLKAWDELPLIG